jgi:2-keto-4-pentenoate hydratase/2-oxohepta-3-ene-1,7-dioic acid hydratase in catechol pathway
MIFDIPSLIAFLSQGTTLEAGSIIMTGTPSGVGFVMKPPQYLTDGDTVEIWIEGVGTLMNPIKHAV